MSDFNGSNGHKTLCWNCVNATGGCSWSEYDTWQPVKGWKARKARIKNMKDSYIDTFDVYECPEFISDPPRKNQNKYDLP